MKKDLHPNYIKDASITCSCGAEFTTGATREELSIESCSQCHPAYTGKKKIIDSTGRVDRFKKLAEKAAKAKNTRKDIKSKEDKKEEKAKKQEKATA
ncbi:MAG: 50S ribosomal protein L31 [Candidatus Moraniibacteriota bacterium]|jgi:large subunit ribosomal protein L31